MEVRFGNELDGCGPGYELSGGPLESPLERLFVEGADKYLANDVLVAAQQEVTTSHGLFRADFVAARADGLRVAIECDGEQYHDRERDRWRDAAILGSGAVSGICRIKGKSIVGYPGETWFLLGRCIPWLLGSRAHEVLEGQVIRCAADEELVQPGEAGWQLNVPARWYRDLDVEGEEDRILFTMSVDFRTLEYPPIAVRHQFLTAHPTIALDDAIAASITTTPLARPRGSRDPGAT